MQLTKEIGQLFGAFGRIKTVDQLNPVLDSLGVLNMLNMKYVIYNKQAAPLVNPYANGNAWFVKNIRVAADANEEMKLVGEIDTKHELVMDKSLSAQLPAQLTPGQYSANFIDQLQTKSFGVQLQFENGSGGCFLGNLLRQRLECLYQWAIRSLCAC